MADRPNILFITTDQQRFDSLPSYGAQFAIAPNLERLASEGVVFERCYVPAPVCVPTRAAIMSGQYPCSNGVIDNFGWLESGVRKWTDIARDAGYRTAAVGKMHFAPWDLMEGFDERIVCEDKRHFYIPDDHYRFMAEHGIQRPHPMDMPGYFETRGAPDYPYAKELHPDSFIADRGAAWIRENASEPFAMWLSFVGPHDPYDPPPEYSALYDAADIPPPIPAPRFPERAPSFLAQAGVQPGVSNSVYRVDSTKATPGQIDRWRRHYFGNITLIDEGIGQVFAALEEADIMENTVIVFTSDHGDALGDHRMVFKSFFYESMVHVPLIVRDGRNTGRRDAIVGTLDVIAWIHELLGGAGENLVQGSSIAPVLGEAGASINEYVFSEMPGRAMVFDGRYKYIHAQDTSHELYNLVDDPQETTNIVDEPSFAGRVSALREALLAHQMACTRVHGQSRRAVAYPGRLEMEKRYREELSEKG